MSAYLTPPARKRARVFTRLPAHHRRLTRSAWINSNRNGRPCDSFLEGPSFDRDGNLYVTDVPFGRIFRIDAAGDWSLIAEYDGWPNGLKIAANGSIFIADYKNGLMSLDPAKGTVLPLLETRNSERFKGVNDLVLGPAGEIYFTDQGQTGMHDPTGCVYRLDPDGRLTQLLNTAPSPNGIALDPEGEGLFVAMTRANQIWRIPLHPSGAVAKVGVFLSLPGSLVGPDGLAFDRAGNLYVAQPGGGRIWMVSPQGDILALIESCTAGGMTTNLAFRPGVGELYITESETGTILVAEVDYPGLPLHSEALGDSAIACGRQKT